MTHLVHRQIHHDYPRAASARGVTITDTDGKTYIDASGGAAVSCLGHNNAEVLDAMRRQMRTQASFPRPWRKNSAMSSSVTPPGA